MATCVASALHVNTQLMNGLTGSSCFPTLSLDLWHCVALLHGVAAQKFFICFLVSGFVSLLMK